MEKYFGRERCNVAILRSARYKPWLDLDMAKSKLASQSKS